MVNARSQLLQLRCCLILVKLALLRMCNEFSFSISIVENVRISFRMLRFEFSSRKIQDFAF